VLIKLRLFNKEAAKPAGLKPIFPPIAAAIAFSLRYIASVDATIDENKSSNLLV